METILYSIYIFLFILPLSLIKAKCGILERRLQFFVLTTDGAGVAAVSITDKEHYNWAIKVHFSAEIFFTLVSVLIFKLF